MTLEQTLSRHYLDRLLASPEGRAFVLWQASLAESTDEGRFFELLLERVDDPELHKMIRRHQADETRHAQLFAECAERTGAPRPTIPPELMMLERLDGALGGFFDSFEQSRTGVMEAYLLLQVVEERAVTQFNELEPAFRRIDAQTAEVIRSIAADEDRHLKYCRAISRRYAPDPETHARTLRRFRAVESQVFGEHSRAIMNYALDTGLVRGPRPEMWLWRGLAALGARRGAPRRTRFWQDAPAASAA